jgi:1,4-alpha-glucan branching enzyme
MINIESIFGTSLKKHQFITVQNEPDKIIVYEKGELIYIFNFHTNNSYTDYLIGTHWRSDHMILIETDEERFGGH